MGIEGKIKKIPFNPNTGQKASPTEPATWGSFADALRAYTKGRGAGIGFVFVDDDPFIGTDLDGCVENTGEFAPWAQAIFTQFDTDT